MTDKISFLQQQALMVSQALLGLVSGNFRMVSLNISSGSVTVEVVLEEHCQNDFSAICEFEADLSCLEPSNVNVVVKTTVSSGNITMLPPDENNIHIFRRREADPTFGHD